MQDTLVQEYPETLHLMEEDAVKYPLGTLMNKDKIPPFQIIANLPYAIASPWMEAVLESHLPEKMTLMLQKETADRYTSLPGCKNFGSISIFLHAAYDFKGSHLVSRSCFYPTPKVDSILLHMERKANPFLFNQQARKLIRDLFTQRRKQLGTLCKYFRDKYPGLIGWESYLVKQEFNLKLRPEATPVSIWKTLNNYIE